MKRQKKENIEACKFYYEQNDEGFSKQKVSEIFSVDRHVFTRLKDTYNSYIEPNNPKYSDYMYLFSEKEMQAVEEYINNPSLTKAYINKKYNIGSDSTLNRWLDILGYDLSRRYKYNYNRAYFKQEPNEHLAYWVGFLLADGCISNDSTLIELSLGDRDKEHLWKLAKDLGYTREEYEQTLKKDFGGAYTRDNIVWRLRISSSEMVEDLEKYNIVPRKSLKEKPYIFDTIDLQLAFIRGLIDGDGWIGQDHRGLGLAGSKEVCEYVKNFFESNFDITTNKVSKRQEGKTIEGTLYGWRTENRNLVFKILELLYPENCDIYLDRKFKLAREAIAMIKSRN